MPGGPLVPESELFGNRARADRFFFRRWLRLVLTTTQRVCRRQPRSDFAKSSFLPRSAPKLLGPTGFPSSPVSCRAFALTPGYP